MNPISPAVLVIFAALMRLGSAQTTVSVATTTTIVQGANVPIASLLQQSSISTTFYQYWAGASVSYDSTLQYTLFVPINSAWNNLSSTDQSTLSNCKTGCSGALATVISYHMLLYSITPSTFSTSCLGQFGADTSTYKCRTLAVQPGSSQTHLAVTQVSGNWYVNGAKIVLANQQAANFTVHFIDKWLYPIDTSTTASAYIGTANNTAAGTLISTTCTMCSPLFNALYTKASQSPSSPLYNWFQNWPSYVTSSVTVFVPYSQAIASQYSINTLASYISALTSSSNISFISSIAGAHIIQDKVLYLNPWIASGASYTCGPTTALLVSYGVSCSLTQVNPNTYAVEVGRTSATIIYPDIPIENGVVHIVSNVLNYAYGNLWSIVQIHPSLTKFEQYLQQDTTGVALNLLQSSSSSFTVFAPDDASWPTSINTSALGYNLQLGILQGSVVPYSSVLSLLTTSTSVAMSSAALVTGNRLRFSTGVSGTEVDGGPSNGFVTTYITQPDLGATNGILHIVTSNVFGMPQMTIAQFLLSRFDLTTSAAYVGQMTQAWSLFSNNGGYYTVVVPNNAAWVTFNSNAQLAVIPKSTVLLQNLMLRHYTSSNTQLYNATQFASSGSSLSVKTLNGVITFTAGNPMSGTTPAQFSVSYSTSSANVLLSDILCTNGRVHIVNAVLGVLADATNTQALYSCQNPSTCSSAALLVNFSLLVLGVLFGLFGRRV